MSCDLESCLGDVLQVEARYDDTEAAIILDGEFDLAGVARFWGYLSAVLAPHPLSITVDASGLEFIDSSGLMALVRARDAAAEAGVAFRVRAPVAPTSAHRRVLRGRGSAVGRVAAHWADARRPGGGGEGPSGGPDTARPPPRGGGRGPVRPAGTGGHTGAPTGPQRRQYDPGSPRESGPPVGEEGHPAGRRLAG